MRKMRPNINSLFQVISAESFKAASANESKRSSISEPFENEIIPRSIHALVDKKTKEFITKVFYKVVSRTLSTYLSNIRKIPPTYMQGNTCMFFRIRNVN